LWATKTERIDRETKKAKGFQEIENPEKCPHRWIGGAKRIAKTANPISHPTSVAFLAKEGKKNGSDRAPH
jgi:hypothetical protein